MAALIVIAIAAGVVIVRESTRPSERTSDGRAASIGIRLFNQAAARCRLTSRQPAAPRQPSLLLGISGSLRLFSGQDRCEEAQLAQATGVQAVREDIGWASVEPSPNVYTWASTDALVAAVDEAGLMLLPILRDPPGWAAPTKSSLPSTADAYAAFVAATVSRYGPGGTFWRANPSLPSNPIVWYELWNEPYYADHNRDPGVYARLVQAAVTAGRAACPGARFLIEADTTYQTLSGSTANWIAGMYDAVPDLGNYFDGLAVHPYGGDPAIYTPDRDSSDQPGRIEQEHSELAAHGDGDKPLWVTEIGWSTCSGAALCVSESQQAAYLRTFLDLARTTWGAYVRAVFVYQLRDSAPNPPDDRDAWYGLLAPDLSRKPAWWVLHDAATSS